jgi:hypothetical protein
MFHPVRAPPPVYCSEFFFSVSSIGDSIRIQSKAESWRESEAVLFPSTKAVVTVTCRWVPRGADRLFQVEEIFRCAAACQFNLLQKLCTEIEAPNLRVFCVGEIFFSCFLLLHVGSRRSWDHRLRLQSLLTRVYQAADQLFCAHNVY